MKKEMDRRATRTALSLNSLSLWTPYLWRITIAAANIPSHRHTRVNHPFLLSLNFYPPLFCHAFRLTNDWHLVYRSCLLCKLPVLWLPVWISAHVLSFQGSDTLIDLYIPCLIYHFLILYLISDMRYDDACCNLVDQRLFYHTLFYL